MSVPISSNCPSHQEPCVFSAGFSVCTLIAKDIPGILRRSFCLFTAQLWLLFYPAWICMKWKTHVVLWRFYFWPLVLPRRCSADLSLACRSMTGYSRSKETCSFKVRELEYRPHLDESTSHQRLSVWTVFCSDKDHSVSRASASHASVSAAFMNLTRITALEGEQGPVLLIHCQDSVLIKINESDIKPLNLWIKFYDLKILRCSLWSLK